MSMKNFVLLPSFEFSLLSPTFFPDKVTSVYSHYSLHASSICVITKIETVASVIALNHSCVSSHIVQNNTITSSIWQYISTSSKVLHLTIVKCEINRTVLF